MPGRDSWRRHHGRLLGPSLKDDVRWLEGRCLSPPTLLSPPLPSHATFTTLSYASIHLLMIPRRRNQTALIEHVLFPLAFSYNDVALSYFRNTIKKRGRLLRHWCSWGVFLFAHFDFNRCVRVTVPEPLTTWLGFLQPATAGFSSPAVVAFMQTPLRCPSS